LIGAISLIYFQYKQNESSYAINQSSANFETSEKFYNQRVPIQPRVRLGYGDTADAYIESGKRDVERMLEVVQNSGLLIKARPQVLEFGCSAGRMLRWIPEYLTEGEYYGVDIESEAIRWAQMNLPSSIKLATTTRLPHLPFEDNSFDYIYAGSVFTHIDDMNDAWLYELRRILKVSAVMFLSYHDEVSLEIVKGRRTPGQERFYNILFEENDLQSQIEENFQFAVVGRNEYTCQIIYNSKHIQQKLNAIFSGTYFENEAYGWQTGAVVTK
jgi:ubiquinone/menaquinone biosynthesis C-methylase UbiE